MGDRCYFQIVVPQEYVPIFVKEAIGNIGSEDPMDYVTCLANGLCLYDDDQMNYGGTMLLGELLEQGVPFVGYHGEGMEYGGMFFACNGIDMQEVDQSQGNVMVPVTYDPVKGVVIHDGYLASVYSYIDLVKSFCDIANLQHPEDPLSFAYHALRSKDE